MNLNNVYMVSEEKSINREFVLNFLEEQYFTREPLMTKFMQLHAQVITPVHREAILGDLRRRYAIILQHCTMFLVGVHVEQGLQCGFGLAMLERRQDLGRVPDWERVPFTSELLAVWCHFVQMVAERQKNFFDLFPDVNTIMRIVMIGVHEDHEGKRMGTNMLREILERSQKYGAELVSGLFTSPHLIRVAHRFGFRSFGDMNLSDFRDMQGNPMYLGAEPQVVCLMAIRVG